MSCKYDFQVNVYDAIELNTTVVVDENCILSFIPFSFIATETGENTFTLSQEPRVNSVQLFKNGRGQNYSAGDFTIDGSDITIAGLEIGDVIFGQFAATCNPDAVDNAQFIAFSFTASSTGTNEFTLDFEPRANSIVLFINGTGQNFEASDYSITGTTLSVPDLNEGDTVYGTYII